MNFGLPLTSPHFTVSFVDAPKSGGGSTTTVTDDRSKVRGIRIVIGIELRPESLAGFMMRVERGTKL